MNLLPALAPIVSSIADLFTRPLTTTNHQRYTQLVLGADPTTLTATTSVATAPTVDIASTVVASATDSVPLLHLNSALAPTHPNNVSDTGASFSIIPSRSDFIAVSQAPYGLIRSATSVASKATTPYTLITGEGVSVNPDPVDPSSTDTDSVDTSVDTFDSKFATAFEVLEFQEFGTATLIFISNPHLALESILVEPTLDWTDWFDWIPLPRLTPTDSYFHIFGRDYLQAFALFHLIPIWIALVSALIRSE